MALTRSLRLFGFDLASGLDYLRGGWSEALHWPCLAWLSPVAPVRVLHADGRSSMRAGTGSVPLRGKSQHVAIAVELPEDLILRRELRLPRLAPDELRNAVALDAHVASPFVEADLAYGYTVRPLGREQLRVDVALASRRQIAGHLESLQAQLPAQQPEIWAPGEPPAVIAGYGESLRAGQTARARRGILSLVLLALLLATALALTPTLQTRQQAIEAQYAYDALLRLAGPQVALREQLVRSNEQLALVREALHAQGNSLALLDALTRQLPDDTVLNQLEIRGEAVRIAGHADNAARLMQSLGANPSFRDVRAPSASARVRGGVKESFTIQFNVASEPSGP